jgi:RNA polymerase sigma factor (sigma-70 family)
MISGDTLSLIKKAQEGDPTALEELVKSNMGLVKSIAVRFRDRGVEFEDLCQIGTIGMIKAIRNFDNSHGTMLSTYAVPLIMGEIRKYLRDDGLIKVSRELKRKGVTVLRAKENFISENGREPTVNELSEACGIPSDDVVECLDASLDVMSFSEPVGEVMLEDILGFDNISEMCDKHRAPRQSPALAEEEQAADLLRFYNGYSQSRSRDFRHHEVKGPAWKKRIMEKTPWLFGVKYRRRGYFLLQKYSGNKKEGLLHGGLGRKSG